MLTRAANGDSDIRLPASGSPTRLIRIGQRCANSHRIGPPLRPSVTVFHSSPPLAAPTLTAAVAALRASGLRVSAARRLVLEALYAADRPVTAEQIADGLGGRFPSSDLASVYRNLETLDELGLVHHLHLGHSAGLYDLVGSGQREYLTCECCGTLEAVAPEALEGVHAAVRAAFGYESRFSHFPIVGMCPACADHPDGRRAPT